MTTEEILNLYGISMSYRTIPAFGGQALDKAFIGGEHMESYFDLGFNSVRSIEEDIIPILDHFIAGNNPPMDHNDAELGSGMSHYALPYIDAVRFHNPHNGAISQTIPLEHFRTIAIAWRDFLLDDYDCKDEVKDDWRKLIIACSKCDGSMIYVG